MTNAWSVAWNTVKTTIGNAVAAVLRVVTDWWNRLRDAVAAGNAWLVNAWRTAWNTVTRTISGAVANILRIVNDWKNRLIGIFSTAINWLLQAGRNIITGLWNGLRAVWDQVAGWLRQMPTNFRLMFTGALSWLLEGGKNILRGLFNGIKAIWETIKDWFSDVPGKIKSLLGIASPPRWAIDAGKFIMRGLMKGLGWGAGKVMDYMGRIAGGFSGALRGAWDSVFASITGLFAGGKDMPGSTGFAGLAEPFASRLAALIAASNGTIGIGSGRRSTAQQAQLYYNYIHGIGGQARAAPPGRSKHERGLAADLVGNKSLAHRLAPIYGLRFPVRGEDWHIELGPGHSYYEKGAWRTGNELAQLHAGEMVLPARVAGAVRSALRGGAASSGTYVAPGAVVIGIPPGATLAEAERLGRGAGRGFLEVLAQRRVVTDARIA